MYKRCMGCNKEATTLQCPTCQKMGKESFFCSQDCFKANWSVHKAIHKTQSSILHKFITPKVISEPDPATGHFEPFPAYSYTGSMRPVYPLSPKRQVPDSIPKPDYFKDGISRSEQTFTGRTKIKLHDQKEIEAMRKVCRLSREVLDIAAAALKPGVTTDYIDEVVHNACIERNAYPSPLNYYHFPKSVCTSVNEIICHGIPDMRPLQDGDIVNIDVSLYHEGFHGDLNETYYVGDKAKADPEAVRVVEASRDCLDAAIAIVKPGTPFREFGNAIEKVAKERGCSVVKSYVGHGVNQLFHTVPNIPHYAKNKAVGTCKPGMIFTIEPMINLGTYKDQTWPDNWTSSTQDGKKSAQFEHTLLVTESGVEILTARFPNSPGGKVPTPEASAAPTNGIANGVAKEVKGEA